MITKMAISLRIIIVILVLFLLFFDFAGLVCAASADSVFEQNQEEFVQDSREVDDACEASNRLWFYGWLELIRRGENNYQNRVDDFVNFIFAPNDVHWDCELWANKANAGGCILWHTIFAELFYGNMISSTVLYPHELGERNITNILKQYRQLLAPGSKFGNNGNHQAGNAVAQYIYGLLYNSDLTFNYTPELEENWSDFTYNGNSYQIGGTYRYRDFWRDYLQLRYWHIAKDTNDGWSTKFLRESDSGYANIYGHQFHLLYDVLNRAIEDNLVAGEKLNEAIMMKRKTAMVLDFMYLEGGMDSLFMSNGNVFHGGPKGRAKISALTDAPPVFLYKPFFDVYDYVNFGENNNLYITQYRLAPLIADMIDIRDEDKYYYRVHKEYKYGTRHHSMGTGKLNFMTSNYSLASSDRAWELNIKSATGIHHMKMWINNEIAPHGPVTQQSGEISIWGENGTQYENNLFVHSLTPVYLHIIYNSDNFDEKDLASLEEVELPETEAYAKYVRYEDKFKSYKARSGSTGWLFFREGDVAVAVKLGPRSAAIQVVTLGKNNPPYAYQAYGDFKSAVGEYASLDGNYFITSANRKITAGDGQYFVYVDGHGQYSLPFKKIETVDSKGNWLIDHENDVMVVSYRGQTCTYDFNNWTMSGDCGENDSAPLETCSDQSGSICSQGEYCDVPYLSAGDTQKCCPANHCLRKTADFDCDNIIGFKDFTIMIAWWDSKWNPNDYQQTIYYRNCGSILMSQSHDHIPDLNQDDRVNVSDLGLLLGQWGR